MCRCVRQSACVSQHVLRPGFHTKCARPMEKQSHCFCFFHFLAPKEMLSSCFPVHATFFLFLTYLFSPPALGLSLPLPARLLARSEAERPLGAPGGGAAVRGRPGGHLAGSLGRLPVRRLQETPVCPPLSVPRPVETPRVQVPACVKVYPPQTDTCLLN